MNAPVPARDFARGSIRHVELAAPPPADSPFEFVMSDGSVDRMGDVIEPDGWQLEAFRRNPVALWGHQSREPIGQWANVRVQKGQLIGELQLAKPGTSPLIDTLRSLIEQRVLRAVSVGFNPLKSEPLNDEADDWFGPFRFTEQELLECSLVSVPANANALAIAKSMALPREIALQIFSKPAKENLPTLARSPASPPKRVVVPIRASKMSNHEQRIIELRNAINVQRDRLSALQAEDVLTPDNQAEFAALPAQLEANINTLREYEAAEHAQALAATLDQSRTTAPAIIVRRDGAPAKKKAKRPFDLIVRSFVITGMSYHLKKHPDELLRDYYGGDEETAAVLRAAHAPAMTTVAGWAAELVQTTVADFLDLLMPDFIYPRLTGYGIRVTFGPYGKISIPARTSSQTLQGDFVGEGNPIPVREASLTAALLTPSKLGVITTFTREMSMHSIPTIEGIVRQAILEDTGKILDTRLLDNVAAGGANNRPAGLLNGVTPITATAITGGALAAFITDMSNLVAAFYAQNAGRSIVLIMNKADAMRAGLLTSTTGDFVFASTDEIRAKFGIAAIVTSTTVPAKTVIAVDAADFASATGDTPQFDVSNQATLHMDDAPTAIGTVGSPNTVAAPTRSLWQTDTIGVRMLTDLTWKMRRTGMVQVIQNVTW